MESSEDSKSNLERHSKEIFSAVERAKRNPDMTSKLRRQLRQLREDLEGSRQLGEDPEQLYPADVWKLIFDELEDINDLVNCSQTCQSFNNIINSSKQQLIFGKILPFVIPFLTGNIDEDPGIWDTLSDCAVVCKKWQFALKSAGFPNSGFLGKPPNCYSAGRPYKLTVCMNALLPFVQVRFKPQRNLFLTTFSIGIAAGRANLLCLDKCGHEIWKLALEFHKDILYSSRQIYSLCLDGLQKCANLRCISLQDKHGNATVWNTGPVDPLTPVSTSLESLFIEIKNPNIIPVQNKLLKCLSAQLKQVKVRYWNSELYKNLSWNSLTELEILEESSVDVLSFLESSVPEQNLQKLGICLDSSCQNLTKLFQALKRFPKLKHVSISLKDNFTAWTEEDILGVPLELLNTKCVTSLEISARNLHKARDLALFFPFVKKLVFYYGDADPESSQNCEITNNRPHLIQLPKNMYKSNIWEILPFLETLKVEDLSVHKAEYRRIHYKEERVKEFTRAGYILERDEYLMVHRTILDFVQKNVKDQARENFTREREILSARMTDPDIIYKHPEMFEQANKDEPLHDQVFHYVTPLLEKPDILTSRLVCKSWKEIVGDKILENCADNISYKFSLPIIPNLESEQFGQFVQDNQQKPFFARKVEICLKYATGNTIGLQLILETLGKQIQYLKISTVRNVVPHICDVYRILRDCMKQCVNLRSLSFEIRKIRSDQRTNKLYEKLKASGILTAPPNLKVISTCGGEYVFKKKKETGLSNIIDDLKLAVRDTVKILEQDRCHRGHFPNLRELAGTISEFDELSCFYKCNKLEKLRLCVTGQNMTISFLWILIRVSCPNLKSLKLNFSSSCGGFDIMSKKSDCTFKITELNIAFQNKSQISLDFLIHFPLVRKLCIAYGKYSLIDKHNMSEFKVDNNADYDVPKTQLENEFIQLVRYFKDETKKEHETHAIYTSNLWSVLKKLHKLEVVYCGKKDIQERAIFNRRQAD